MLELTLGQVAAITHGIVHGDPGLVVSGEAYLDSRRPAVGGLFVAIAGDRVDGHDYVADAHAVLGSRPTGRPTVVVDDPVVALGRLARHVVDTVAPTVVAITGSHGKTGTKDYLAHLLPDAVATPGNLNNELGVPLTALRLRPGDRRLVLEMGARGVGHLTYLTGIAPPRVAAVLALGTAHLGQFGSPEMLARAKGELVAALPADGVAVLASDPRVAALPTRARRLTFGRTGDVRWSRATLDDRACPTATFTYDGQRARVRLPRPGLHQLDNAAAALALAVGAGASFLDVAPRLETASETAPHRMQLRERSDGVLVVDDTYNASPASARAALETVRALGRRLWVVLGEMHELGDAAPAAHREIAEAVEAAGAELIAVGTHLYGRPSLAADEAVARLEKQLRPGDVVLVKASRAAALDRLVAALLDAG